MTFNQIIDQIALFSAHKKYFIFALISSFFLIIFGYFITWPVVGYDTDLWYHLSGGRYFWQHGSIPDTSFFSFIQPSKIWYDYYWGFQVIVAKIFEWGGYHGLVALRAFLYGLTVLLICLFLFRRKDRTAIQWVALCFFVFYALALIHRELLVRPHLFSYFFIVLFLYILEYKREKIWMLPLLGILWANIHGIEYPVMILIVFAYLTEIYYLNVKKTADAPRVDRKTKWLLIATMYSVFITPGIVHLVQTPFNIAYNNALYQQFYVMELLPIRVADLFLFSALPFSNLIIFFQNTLVLTPIALFVIGLWKRNLRVSHIILFVSSLALLIKYNRFIYEFMLLALPLVYRSIGFLVESALNKERKISRVAPLVMIVALLLLPMIILGSKFKHRPAYPFSQINLPAGVPAFLNRLEAGGRVMNEPNTGGYMQWALDNRYKIYMDMQLAIFNDRDFAFINNALNDEHTFRAFRRVYDPSFVCVSLKRNQFPKMIAKFPEFKIVFFDDAEVIYVNALHYPQIAKVYELKAIDPFGYLSIEYETESKERRSLIYNEAMQLRHFQPGSGVANTIIANILVADKHFDKALPYSEAVINSYPDLPYGYALQGDILLGMERFREAVASYQAAIVRAQQNVTRNVYRNLHVSYIRLKDYQKAYKTLAASVNPFNSGFGYKEIYELAMSAAAAGNIRNAVNYLKIAEMKLPPDDADYTKKIKDNILILDPTGKQEDRQ